MTQLTAMPRIGGKMPDGTIYPSISPETNQPMHSMPADAPRTYNFNEARKYAQNANALPVLGHDDWHLPTKNELNVLFKNGAASSALHNGRRFSMGSNFR
jgi:hypothetical protein